MNGGYILGVVREAGRALGGAVIGLDWVRGGGADLTIYSADADSTADRLRSVRRGMAGDMPPPITNLATQTNSEGGFVLSFQWFGGDLGTAMDEPQCRIFVLVDELAGGMVTSRLRGRYTARMVRAVSLGQTSSGLLWNPTQVADQIGLGTDLYAALREIRRPMIGLTVAPPSPDMYALIAGYRINL
jgi:hypothetical protein